ncbi:MAG: PA0069 family radical SAM protein [Flavobacteriaceae bacterium]|nr:PA0069 family radical SAM protein [Flavobacteriaceae bacterium]
MKTTQGQGAQHNPDQRFSKYTYERNEYMDEIEEEKAKTEFLEVFPKTIVNSVNSPDLSFVYSMNPYQGCEHGCAYCYARPTHEFWNYSAGIDFERKILIKKNASELLEKFFQKKAYVPQTIMLSGNTDCYQPAEAKFELTRKLLEICLKYKHPVSIITKNALVLRDLDVLNKLNELDLISVAVSVTTLDEELRRKLEPRTSTARKRLETIKTLSDKGIPVKVMIAPIIPGLNSHELLDILKAVSENGALSFGTTMVRLNDTVFPVFKDWIEKAFPLKAEKVLNQISEVHGGSHEDRRFGTRMRGEGKMAEAIHQTLKIGRQKYFPEKVKITLSTKHFNPNPIQLKLF